MKLERISISDVRQAINCGEQYRLRKELGPVPPGFAQLRGRAVHRSVEANMLAKMDGGELLGLEETADVARDEIARAMVAGEITLDPDYEEAGGVEKAAGACIDDAMKMARAHRIHVAPKIEPSAVELKIEIAATERRPYTLVGVLDLIDTAGGVTRIRDVKTSKKKPAAGASADSDQLTFYDLLHRSHFQAEPDLLVLDPIVQTKTRGIEALEPDASPRRTLEELGAVVARTERVVSAIKADVFLPAPEGWWGCSEKWCGYWSRCAFARGRRRPSS